MPVTLNNNNTINGDLSGSISGPYTGSISSGVRKYNPNSIENKNKTFISYAYSKMGRNRSTNSDNFYCNGSYMKRFSFEDFQRGDSTELQTAVYAVCSGENGNDEACKIAFEVLECCRVGISAAANGRGIKKELHKFFHECNRMLYETAANSRMKNEVSLAVLVLYKGAYYYGAFGTAGLYVCDKNALFIAGDRETSLGISERLSTVKIHSGYYGADTRFMLATNGVISNIDEAGIEECIDEERIVKKMTLDAIGKAARRHTDKNSTCISIAPAAKVGLHLNTILTMVICGIIICADIAILLLNHGGMP